MNGDSNVFEVVNGWVSELEAFVPTTPCVPRNPTRLYLILFLDLRGH